MSLEKRRGLGSSFPTPINRAYRVLLIHSKMRCGNCNKVFDSKTKYINHVKQVCKNKTCPNCKASFSTKQNLDRHLQSKKKITCDHCDGTYCNESHFQKHLRTTKTTDDTIVDLNRRIYPSSGYENDEWYSNLIDTQKGDKSDLVTEMAVILKGNI